MKCQLCITKIWYYEEKKALSNKNVKATSAWAESIPASSVSPHYNFENWRLRYIAWQELCPYDPDRDFYKNWCYPLNHKWAKIPSLMARKQRCPQGTKFNLSKHGNSFPRKPVTTPRIACWEIIPQAPESWNKQLENWMLKKREKTNPASTVYRSHKFREKRHTMLAEGCPQSPESEQKKCIE